MAKLSIGIGEDFPVEDKPATEDCASRHRRHGHHHHHHDPHSLHARWHQWMHKRFSRHIDDKKAGDTRKDQE